MLSTVDRVNLLRLRQTQFTGIDFVHVVDRCDETTLQVFFQTDLSALAPPFQGATRLDPARIFIEAVADPTVPRVPVVAIDEIGVQNQAQQDTETQRWFITIHVAHPGTFARYRIRIEDPLANPNPVLAPFSRVDSFFNAVEFSFKVGCDDRLDCQTPPVDCPPQARVDFPVDYLARDFVSLQNALLDFAGQRFPGWTTPIAADMGTMVMEVFAAVGDELSYTQDRYARESNLETATQRRTLRKKARLLDFEIHDGLSASTSLVVHVDPAQLAADGTLPPPAAPGTRPFVEQGQTVWSDSDNTPPVPFEIGRGLNDLEAVQSGGITTTRPRQYRVDVSWNPENLTPFIFDSSQACLPIGATELFVVGAVQDPELFRDVSTPRLMLMRTSTPPKVTLVRVIAIDQFVDPLQADQLISRIQWNPDDALPFQMDQADLTLSLNVVPATAGETLCTQFAVGPVPLNEVVDSSLCTGAVNIPPPDGQILAQAVEREGPLNVLTQQRGRIVIFSLPETDQLGLGFVGEQPRGALPELTLEQIGVSEPWTFFPSLLEAGPEEPAFTLEDGQWGPIRQFRSLGQVFVHQDYIGGLGYSLRFGDGDFGLPPAEGARFVVHYRTGPGSAANVPHDTITAPVVPGRTREIPAFIDGVTNPQAVTSGVDPESADEIKQAAPQAFRAPLFAVRPEDFETQLQQQLGFVQRAHGSQRWTGSWSSMFVSADPFGAANLTSDQQTQVQNLVDCVRQAGRDVIVRAPDTVAIDVEITICIERFAYPAHVAAQLQEVLLGTGTGTRVKGFFHPDNFTFGTPLRRSALEAAIQAVPGVRSVRLVRVRKRGVAAFKVLNKLTLSVGLDQILRLDNDPLRPENGTLTLITEGGA